MKRDMVKIDEDLCNGCGLCIPNCHEGALQIIDNKAVLISDLMCDGLGACIGHCPEGAITIEEREAEPYDEVKVMKEMVKKGKNTIAAHLEHLRDHGEDGYLQEGIKYLKENRDKVDFDVHEVVSPIVGGNLSVAPEMSPGCSCQGSAPQQFEKPGATNTSKSEEASALTHWPVQMHLINPAASYFRNCDLLVAADCTAFSMGGFHSKFLSGKSLVIACPKLDQGTDVYIEKFVSLIDHAMINTLTVMIMEVPCCGGLLRMVQNATSMATRKVPVKLLVASIKGEILEEEWV